MFCTTFYSYKGGVGRTLALANAAVLLAQQGKKVLAVDFDLEAPGLTTMDPFAPAAGAPGVLDYVDEYLATGTAPDVERFVTPCTFLDGPSEDERRELRVDVMTAGRDDEAYGIRFASLDWNDLYENRDGFILVENLRAGWKDAGYDYVLVDSRTGHTDIGGICTRQLPDAVVAVFFPNEQNLQGLVQVVQGVRDAAARPRPIDLLFVASRVPRLDDEHGHLRRRLERSQSVLGYEDDQLVVIEHYDSLMLLNQSLFALERPRSGLAQQYAALVARLAQFNPEDAAGAFALVNAIANSRQTPGARTRGGGLADLAGRLDAIAKEHRDDCVLQYALARAYYRLRGLQNAAKATDAALASLGRTDTGREIEPNLSASVHRLRTRIFTELESPEEVLSSARAVLQEASASSTMIIDALRILASVDALDTADLASLPAIASSTPDRLLLISRQLSDTPSAAPLAGKLAEQVLRRHPDLERHAAEADLLSTQLGLIAGGRFDEAVAIGERASPEMFALPVRFNTAVARWGRDHEPDAQEFAEVLASFASDRSMDPADPNHQQCLALAHAVLGQTEQALAAVATSRTLLDAKAVREFSCWGYFTVAPAEFREHLAALAAFATGTGSPPEVLARAWAAQDGSDADSVHEPAPTPASVIPTTS